MYNVYETNYSYYWKFFSMKTYKRYKWNLFETKIGFYAHITVSLPVKIIKGKWQEKVDVCCCLYSKLLSTETLKTFVAQEDIQTITMYCLQWLIPVLLLPKPVNPAFLYNHAMFMVLYLTSFFLERKPCTICSLVFIVAVILICYSCTGNCLFWNCDENCQTGTCSNEALQTWKLNGIIRMSI